MNRIIFLIAVLSGLFACSNSKTSVASPDKSLLLGDWIHVSTDTSAADDRTTRKLIYTFEDSLCSLEHPFSDFVTYTLRNDSVLTSSRHYKIIELTADSLVLHTPPIDGDPLITGTIRLSKVKAKNDLRPSKIYFASSVCFGTCPSMLLEIDSAGQFTFLGKHATNPIGGFRGQLDTGQLRIIINKINNLPLDSLQEKYHAGWTDDQNSGVAILTKDKKIVSSAYGYDKEPVELRILFHKLMTVYKVVSLSPDSEINDAYFKVRLEGVDIVNQ
jgi:hypothetical protein